MQIQLASLIQNQSRNYKVGEDKETGLIEGRRGYAVRVGDRLIGFSGDEVSEVALQVEDGNLHIKLRSGQGQSLAEYRVPSTDVLEQQFENLRRDGLHFEATEREELARLMKLSMQSSISRTEILLLLDEISHVAAEVRAGNPIEIADLHPRINEQINNLLKAMPNDMQRYVILSNADAFPQDLWRAFHFISKIDASTDTQLTRFIAGQVPPDYRVLAEINEVASREMLGAPTPITRIDPDSLLKLVNQLKNIEVFGNDRFFNFAEPLSKLIFDRFSLKIPDFTSANSFEELERNLITGGKIAARRNNPSAPLENFLLKSLDVKTYRELADFLTGKTGRFTIEAKESLIHFLKNRPNGTSQNPLSSMDANALKRIRHYLGNSPHSHLTKDLPVETPPVLPVDKKVAGLFASLNKGQRLALFVLNHLDPSKHTDLFDYFKGNHGLSKMTPSMQKQLSDFLNQKHFPEVKGGLNHVQPSRFKELQAQLANFSHLSEPEGFIPKASLLSQVITEDKSPTKPNLVQTTDSKGLQHHEKDAIKKGRALEAQLSQIPDDQLNQEITHLLKKNISKFRRVAMLDQIWKVDRLSNQIRSEKAPVHEAARQIGNALRDIMDLLVHEPDAEVDWDLWRQKKQIGPTQDPRASLQKRALAEESGLNRYTQLDQWLPDRTANLSEKVESLGWVRRLERFLNQIDKFRHDNHPKLIASLEKNKIMMRELEGFAMEGDNHEWMFHSKSPLTKKKQRQFDTFREGLLNGGKPDAEPLFKEPFLRPEFGERSESLQRLEMQRFEPLFKEAMRRFASDPGELIQNLMETLRLPSDMTGQDAGTRLQSFMDSLREFNQHQNLNQQPMYMALPLRFKEGNCDMELAYFRMPGSTKDKRRFLVVLHLDFENWGHLRVDALRDDGQLSATFWVESPKMHRRILKELHNLEDRLEENGLGDAELTVKIEPQRATSSVAKLCAPVHDGEVDLSI